LTVYRRANTYAVRATTRNGDMIRLAVIGEGVSWQGLGSRLRGGMLEASLNSSLYAEPAADCHAVAFLAPACPQKDEVERLLHAGKHVLLATEPCIYWPDLCSLWHTAHTARVQLSVVNPDRYLPSRHLIRDQLGSKLGATGMVRLHRWVADSSTTMDLPRALLADLDLALWLTGESPVSTFALENKNHGYLQVHLGFPSGGMALIDHAGRLPAGDEYRALSVIASSGAAYVDDAQNQQLLYRGGHAQAVRTEETMRQRAVLLQEFIDALHEKCDLSANRSAWHEVYQVADAVRQSLACGRAVAREGSA
jgi:predicted dehydrogenase